MIQDLPFSIQLDKFIVDYYSTGMPKLFASDIVMIDNNTGKRIPARVEVNKPVDVRRHVDLSVELPGRRLEARDDRLADDRRQRKTTPFGGTIGGTAPIDPHIIGAKGDTVEFGDFRAINVENITNGSGAGRCTRRRESHTLKQAFDKRLGSGAKTSKPSDLHNVGPSVQYKVRSTDGQAREYNNYMLPVRRGRPADVPRGHAREPERFVPLPAHSRRRARLRQAVDEPACGAGDARDACRSGAPVRAAFGAAGRTRVAGASGGKRRARAEPVRRRRRSRRGAAEWPGHRRLPGDRRFHRPFRAEGRAGKGGGPAAAHAGRRDLGPVADFPRAQRPARSQGRREKHRIRPIVDQCTFGQLSVRIAGLFATRFVQADPGVGVPVDARTRQKTGVSWQPPARTRHLLDVLRT